MDFYDLKTKEIIGDAEKLAVKVMTIMVEEQPNPITAYVASLLVHKYLKGVMLDRHNSKDDEFINVILLAMDNLTDQMIVDFFKPEVTKE